MVDNPAQPRNFQTIVTHADADVDDLSNIAPSIHPTTTFLARDALDFAAMATEPRHPRYYTRYGNPTHQRVEETLARLEGAEAALVTGSGMGAITATMLALVTGGDHIVAQQNHYMGTTKLLSELLPRFGVTATFVDQTNPAAFAEAIQDNTRLLMLESPVNPLLHLTDLKAVADLAKGRGVLTVVDNTFATPINQRPLEFGVDVVVHSATKYLGGHHDLTAGVVAGSKALVERIWGTHILVGSVLSAFDAWLLLRGLRTLPLRVRQHNQTALAVATFLANQPGVEKVHYPGLAAHPQHELARLQMPAGCGGVLSFQIKGGYQETQQFMSQLKLINQAVSLGGYETLAAHVAAMWAGTLTDEQFRAAGVEPNLVRFSTGLEDASDIIADLAQALATMG
ncbi:MAG: aminotransferase class I/II-fold pyridoxal phosphate-dependent enzyme [Anaerolineaceae bacterium]|nr:aminotransferase class I/II-fold pyridoxal phosphate-dependent enzyme [Anaerolineaceae bacterium]MCB9102278.1 aminotransferase class I/II-fold pyridoxal phosphate-dependent enzyme [Anaerolineales bacterium]